MVHLYTILRTNLPKELMDFPNFPYKSLDNVSFLNSRQVQEYIEQFTEHFGLNKYIRVRIYFLTLFIVYYKCI